MSQYDICKALVISCIDYRFVSKVEDYLANKNLQDSYDLVTTPGASLNFKKIENNIAISFNLHDPKNVMIFDHEDCGAYGEDNSEDRHVRNLISAKGSIQLMNPKIDVKIFIAGFEGIKEVN
jgi:carbonic anhydrase